MEARAMEGSPSITELFTHIHFVRLVFIFEDAPEFAGKLPEEEWVVERDPERLDAQELSGLRRYKRAQRPLRLEGQGFVHLRPSGRCCL